MASTAVRLPPTQARESLETSFAKLKIERAVREKEKNLTFSEWCKKHFGAVLWDTQDTVGNAILSGQNVVWKGCHGIGKSWSISRVICRFLKSHPKAVVLLTGMKYETVLRTIFAEVRRAVQSDPNGEWGELLQGELRLSDDNYLQVFTTDDPTRIQGFHAGEGKILIVIDEAQGMNPALMTSLEGIRAGGDVQIVMLGNPTNPSGEFAKAFKDGSGFTQFTTSAFDTPNLRGYTLDDLLRMPEHELKNNPSPHLVGKDWVVRMYHKWGPTSPLWMGRVLGEFPEQSTDAVIWTEWLDQAKENRLPDPGDTDVYAGLDVAGGGKNETVLTLRTGGQILRQIGWTDSIGEETGYIKIVAELNQWKDRLKRITVDSDGMGFTLARELRGLGFPARMFQGSKPCPPSSVYENKKAEAWFAVRRMFELGTISGLFEDDAYTQLAAPTYYNNPRTGKIIIENKKMLASRGITALDWADSIVLAFQDGEDLPDPRKVARATYQGEQEPAPAYLDPRRDYWIH